MIMEFVRNFFWGYPLAEADRALDAEYEPVRDVLSLAGVDDR